MERLGHTALLGGLGLAVAQGFAAMQLWKEGAPETAFECFRVVTYSTSFDKLISSNLGTLSMSRREKGRWFSTIILQLGFKTQPKLGFHPAFLASV